MLAQVSRRQGQRQRKAAKHAADLPGFVLFRSQRHQQALTGRRTEQQLQRYFLRQHAHLKGFKGQVIFPAAGSEQQPAFELGWDKTGLGKGQPARLVDVVEDHQGIRMIVEKIDEGQCQSHHTFGFRSIPST